jgi:hypothetical protein
VRRGAGGVGGPSRGCAAAAASGTARLGASSAAHDLHTPPHALPVCILPRQPIPKPKRAEAAWFDHHSEYAEVASQCGVGALARRINSLLGTHIRTLLPALRRQIADALEARAAELAGYGEELDLGSDSAK